MLQERLLQGMVSFNMVAHLLSGTKKSGLVIDSLNDSRIKGWLPEGIHIRTLWLDIHRPTFKWLMG